MLFTVPILYFFVLFLHTIFVCYRWKNWTSFLSLYTSIIFFFPPSLTYFFIYLSSLFGKKKNV